MMKYAMKKPHILTILGVVFSVGTVCLLLLTAIAATQQTPKITIHGQQGTPIVISAQYVDASTPTKPIFIYVLANVSTKPIRAYTIKHEVSYGDAQYKSHGANSVQLPSISQALLPNRSRQEEGGGETRYSQPVNEIALSVDFVEFADGTTWGEDEYKFAEKLAGVRAGGKAALKKFREKLNKGGLDALVEVLTQDDITAPDILNGSQERKDGFETGVSVIRHRLKQAKDKGGLEAVTRELAKPFDASEGREQR
ncbi:MAG: hypothetical protein MSG64_14980 [Pyrinomonadaceae bacterium MAG19_C2-C3]|nr:hypothetical protein [Pyrinomonadaceae bacterium MAG19_C2-C3]